jgi:hypothetical protein
MRRRNSRTTRIKSQNPLSDRLMHSEGRVRLNWTIRFYRAAFRFGLTLVSLIFVKTLLAQVQYPQLDSISAFLILKLALVGYLYCWYYGCARDLNVHNDVLTDAPKPTWKEVGITTVIVLGFLFLFYTSSLRLLTANIPGWIYLKYAIRPFVDEAIKIHQSSKDIIAELKTKLYIRYIFGRWQQWRFLVGLVMLILLMSITFKVIPIPIPLSRDVAFALFTVLTMLILEVWMWHERLKLKHQWDGLDWMQETGYTVLSSPV